MVWQVLLHEEFEQEFQLLPLNVQQGIVFAAGLLEVHGPTLGRPTVDTLKGSSFPNMKEIRFACGNGAWRIAFAFDPSREAILLVCGDKAGANQKKFYETLIRIADRRYGSHLEE